MYYESQTDKPDDIRNTYAALQAEYGRENAVYPLLKWIRNQQSVEPYAVKDNYVYLKLELELAHLIAEREIIAHTVRRSGEDLPNSAMYRQTIQKN